MNRRSIGQSCVSAVVGQCPAWEWVEVYNNTGSTIDFGATHCVFDDDDEASLATANILSGTIAQGATGVLFNASGSGNTLANMQAAWGQGINFIPVTTWTDSYERRRRNRDLEQPVQLSKRDAIDDGAAANDEPCCGRSHVRHQRGYGLAD